MKKFIALILALAMLLSFCACENKAQKNKTGETVIDINYADTASVLTLDSVLPSGYTLQQALQYYSAQTLKSATIASYGAFYAPAKDEITGTWGYIDLKGNWVIKPQYTAATAFVDGYATVLDDYKEYQMIDRAGNTVLYSYNGGTVEAESHFSEGYVVVTLDLEYTQHQIYLDATFKKPGAIYATSLPTVRNRAYGSRIYFGLATPFKNGKAVVMRLKNTDITDKRGAESAYVINTSGTAIATLPSGLDISEWGFDDNMMVIVKNSDGLYGLCDEEGNLTVECTYRRLQHCEGQLYLVCNDAGFWGYIDKNGNKIIDCQYQKAMPFSEGLAAVYDGKYWGFIYENGSYAIESTFDDVAALKYAYIDSSTNKGAVCEGIMAVKKDGYWILTDTDINILCCLSEAQTEGITGSPYKYVSNGYISYCKNVSGKIKYGVIDSKGKEVLSPTLSNIGMFN